MATTISKSKTLEIVEALKTGKPIDAVANDCGVGKTTVYRVRAAFAGTLSETLPKLRRSISRQRMLDKRLNANVR